MKTFTAVQLSILWITLRYSYAVSPIVCNATEPLAGKALDLINKGRSNGYLFQLLRVADAHLDKAESTDVYYLVLDVKESDCPVQSRKHWDDCEPSISRYLFDIVIGQCKVIATTRLSAFQDLRVNDFNCTTSSVFSALANTKDSPVLLDFFEETEVYRKQAEKVLEMYKKENGDFASFRVDQVERVGQGIRGRRTNYYIDFSVRNCSSHHFHRHYNVFGFCRSVLSYDVGASDLETPIEVDTNCEVFDLKEHRNISDVQPHLDHLLHSGGHGHSSGGKPPFTHSRSRDNLHHHKPHKPGCPPPMDDKNHSERPPLQAGASLPLPPSRCHHLHFHINDTHAPHHNHSSSEHQSHGHHPHDHHPHGHQPHRHRHHGHHPHGHHPHGQLLTSFAQEDQPQEVDCNDEDVFKAVDAALKKYNDRNKSGNQFVLYRITEVTKTEDENIFYSVKYEIKEGDCPVQSGKTWQDCDYKEAEQAVSVMVRSLQFSQSRPNYSISAVEPVCEGLKSEGPVVTSKYECYGCVHPISTASPDLDPVLRHAIQHFNNHTNHPHLFALKEVKRAQRQVVSGWNYEVTYLIQQTNCSKENFTFLTQDCKALFNADSGECTDFAYMDPQLRIASFSQKCEVLPGEDFVPPPTRICRGCPKEIPVDSPKLKEALTHSITKLNAESNATFYFKIDIVHKATSQVVAGTKYFVEFTARETTCSKESNKELTESCEIKKHGEILRCTADVYVVPLENKIYPTVKCQSVGKTSLLKRPPGFSPFRSVQVAETKEGTTKQLRPCVYKGRPREAGAEPTSESEVS
ncbi:Kininogen-1 [Myotis brandtii]|uniref:Histidine-rich glycoprotein n=1 Tax=Myotis brandtii TaxID=109478 RepID=S7NYS9_MYOBR|nr:Kininogen-1 [Myotis brandtii]